MGSPLRVTAASLALVWVAGSAGAARPDPQASQAAPAAEHPVDAMGRPLADPYPNPPPDAAPPGPAKPPVKKASVPQAVGALTGQVVGGAAGAAVGPLGQAAGGLAGGYVGKSVGGVVGKILPHKKTEVAAAPPPAEPVKLNLAARAADDAQRDASAQAAMPPPAAEPAETVAPSPPRP